MLDNWSTHQLEVAKEHFEKEGLRYAYIPPYWPELAPIELYFNQLKGLLNKAAFSDRLKAESKEWWAIIESWIENVTLMKVINTWKRFYQEVWIILQNILAIVKD